MSMFPRPSYSRLTSLAIAGVCALALWSVPISEAGVVTYLSSTRYIEGNGIPREDAVGFNDFDISRGAFIGVQGSGLLYARVEAAQTSRLLPDRIEVNLRARTQFIENPQGNSISALSLINITFEINSPTQVALSTGLIVAGSGDGIASVALERIGTPDIAVLVATSSGPIRTANVIPGTYRLVAGARAGSLQSIAGVSSVIATITVPAPPQLLTLGLGAAALTSIRRRYVASRA